MNERTQRVSKRLSVMERFRVDPYKIRKKNVKQFLHSYDNVMYFRFFSGSGLKDQPYHNLWCRAICYFFMILVFSFTFFCGKMLLISFTNCFKVLSINSQNIKTINNIYLAKVGFYMVDECIWKYKCLDMDGVYLAQIYYEKKKNVFETICLRNLLKRYYVGKTREL